MDQNTPYFRDLYKLIQAYDGQKVYQEILEQWLPKARQAVAELQQFRSFDSTEAPYDDKESHLWQWYALSRVNDCLLEQFLPYRTYLSEAWLNMRLQQLYAATHTARLGRREKIYAPTQWVPSRIMDGRSDVWNDYVRFFNRLGFRTFGKRPFHPFHSEIVEVSYNPAMRPGSVSVDSVCWPGVMFGNMMFSRSGVRVSCCEGTLNKKVAEDSKLYFTYHRTRRITNDLSMGCGSGSQWGTNFRRDYVDERMFHFNVDGVCELGPNYETTCPPRMRSDLDELTMEEKIELLIHRCFVKCEKESQWDRFPFFDRHSMLKLREMRYRNAT